eukprot:PLAT11185.1.p1 GENE.PLAT11185.1~~PLAT11185.1.p1  ORF type:complete len:534 (+),score=235.17 PLAT11185.1:116-1603(+)
MLEDSAAIAAEVGAALPAGGRAFVLGDTSYGSCCVDEVAAAHLDAELIVHFGDACCSPTQRLPVLYIFGRKACDVDAAAAALAAAVKEDEESGGGDGSDSEAGDAGVAPLRPFVLLSEHNYAHAAGSVAEKLQELLAAPVIVARPDILPGCAAADGWEGEEAAAAEADGATEAEAAVAAVVSVDEKDSSKESSSDGRMHAAGYVWTLPDGVDMSACRLLWLGGESRQLSGLLMRFSDCLAWSFDPSAADDSSGRREGLLTNKALMKRFYHVQKARDASIVGILVGTLGVARYLDALQLVRKLVDASGRKAYVFVVGKINVAKLANFAEVDVFVLVACPRNSLLDSRDFYRPIITPFELEMAVGSREWGRYSLELADLGWGEDDEASAAKLAAAASTPYFSSITGELVGGGGDGSSDEEDDEDEDEEDGDGEEKTSGEESAKGKEVMVWHSPAADFLATREYRGLEVRKGETEVMPVREGRVGRAVGYAADGEAEG